MQVVRKGYGYRVVTVVVGPPYPPVAFHLLMAEHILMPEHIL